MADDSYKIEFESNLNETIKHVVEGTPPDFEAAVRSELAALEGEGDIPGSKNNPAPTTSNGTQTLQGGNGGVAQLGSDDAFGQGKKFGDPGAGYGPAGPAYKPKNYNALFAEGAADANSAPAIAKQVGNLGSNFAKQLTSSFTKIASVASSTSSALGAVALVGGEVALTLGVFTTTLLGVIHILDSSFKAMAENWRDISPSIAISEGKSEMELTAHKLRTEYRVGENVASVNEARTDLNMTFMNLAASVMDVIGPNLEFLMETAALILEVINAILRVTNAFFSIFKPITKFVVWLEKNILIYFMDNSDDMAGSPNDRIMNFLLKSGVPDSVIKTFKKDTLFARSFHVDL